MGFIISILGGLIKYVLPAWFKAKHEQAERMKEAVEIKDDPKYKDWAKGDVL